MEEEHTTGGGSLPKFVFPKQQQFGNYYKGDVGIAITLPIIPIIKKHKYCITLLYSDISCT